MNLFTENLRTNNENNMCFQHFCTYSYRKACDTLIFTIKNMVNKEDFSKLSTGEIPVQSGRTDSSSAAFYLFSILKMYFMFIWYQIIRHWAVILNFFIYKITIFYYVFLSVQDYHMYNSSCTYIDVALFNYI